MRASCVVGMMRVMLSYSNISAALGKYAWGVHMLANVRISLINYFYFFLDLHEQEAYSALSGM
jgi:hypothetical protein